MYLRGLGDFNVTLDQIWNEYLQWSMGNRPQTEAYKAWLINALVDARSLTGAVQSDYEPMSLTGDWLRPGWSLTGQWPGPQPQILATGMPWSLTFPGDSPAPSIAAMAPPLPAPTTSPLLMPTPSAAPIVATVATGGGSAPSTVSLSTPGVMFPFVPGSGLPVPVPPVQVQQQQPAPMGGEMGTILALLGLAFILRPKHSRASA